MTERYDALTVRESNGKSYWTKIGAMFQNRTGDGYTLVLDAVPGSTDGQYRIILREPQERQDNQQRGSAQGGGRNQAQQSGRTSQRWDDGLDDDQVPYR